jgi:hypothetical protein
MVTVAAIVALGIALGPALIQTLLFDNRPSGVACEDLPDRAAVEEALASHADLTRRIEDLDPTVEVLVKEPCDNRPGAAEIVVYPGGDLRERIEGLLAEESFGVPTTLRNV